MNTRKIIDNSILLGENCNYLGSKTESAKNTDKQIAFMLINMLNCY